MDQYSLTKANGLQEARQDSGSRLEWKIGLGLFIVCILGILINLFE